MTGAAAVQGVMDALGHLKAIGHEAAAKPRLDKAGVAADEGVTDLDSRIESAEKRSRDFEPKVRTWAGANGTGRSLARDDNP